MSTETLDRTVAPRERILATAYNLFSQRGIRDVGVDEMVSRSGVARATLYRHFPSKDDLVLAYLERREQLWTRELVEAEALRRGSTPEEQLLAIFDVFDEWFTAADPFEACSFVRAMLEMGPEHPVGRASIRHLDHIRTFVNELATQAGLREPAAFTGSWMILMRGSIIVAAEGDTGAAQHAKAMALCLIDRHRP
jgi:AcrR family transcriptional regulator